MPRAGHVVGYMLDVPHWLPSPLFLQCLLALASVYLRELSCSILVAKGHSALCSVEWGMLPVPFAHISIRQNYAFSLVDHPVWNWPHTIGALRLYPRSILTTSTLALKLFFLAMLGSAAHPSSNLKEVLYKSL